MNKVKEGTSKRYTKAEVKKLKGSTNWARLVAEKQRENAGQGKATRR